MQSDPADRADVPMKAGDEPERWLDKARNVNKIVYLVVALAAGLLAVDPLIHKHGPFEIEHWWGFYGIYGFLAYFSLVLVAKQFRKLVMRGEDYYD